MPVSIEVVVGEVVGISALVPVEVCMLVSLLEEGVEVGAAAVVAGEIVGV